MRVGLISLAAGALLAGLLPAQTAGAAQKAVVAPAAATARAQTASARVASATVAGGPKVATGVASTADRSDVALNGWGDQRGYHLAVATAASSWAWREVAVLRPGRVEEASWLGYQCVSGDGRYAAVTVLPASAINSAAARDRGAEAYSVDLVKGTVRPVAAGVGFKYHSPGCGTADTAVFTLNPGVDQASTVVLTANLASGQVTNRVTVAGQVTSVVPTSRGAVGVQGVGLVRVARSGKPMVIAISTGTPFELRPAAGGAVAFLNLRSGSEMVEVEKLRAGKLSVLGSGSRSEVHLFQGRGGHPVLVGVSALSAGSGLARVSDAGLPGGATSSSLSGRVLLGEAITSKSPVKSGTGTAAELDAAAARAQAAPPILDTTTRTLLTRPAAASNQRVTMKLPAVAAQPTAAPSSPATSAKLSGSAADTPAARPRTAVTPAAAGTPKCAVPRLAENRQVLQPWPAQIDWAVQMAEQGLLTGTAQQRPSNYANLGLAAYDANTDFPRVGLSHPSGSTWDTVPRSVYEAIMAQESNWSQASWHALPGIAGNPLIADYYGAAGGINTINYAGADCGYGIGQVTSGMAATDTTYSANGKTKIAVDYEENIAAGLQILERTWNQLYTAGVTANGGDPKYLENWYFAAWAYNTGIQPNAANGNTSGCTPGPSCVGPDGTWGLGWTNNPQNADYPPTRAPYLRDTYADAAHPGLWPYQERIMGWMSSPLIRLSQPAYAKPTYNGGNTWLQIPPATDFCTVAGDHCDPTYTASDPSLSYCTLSDRECWWHGAVTWVSSCSTTCATSGYTAAAGSAEPAGGADPHPPTCSLNTSTVPTTSTGAPIIVDESQSQPPLNRVGCGTPNWSQGGTFSMAYGQNSAGDNIGAIDTHQLGAGLGGHILFSHTENGSDPSVVNTGTWTPTLPKTEYYKVKIHLPGTAASATDVVYKIYPGGGVSPWKIRVNQAWGSEQWVTIGTFAMQNGGYVTLSNTSTDTAYGDASYSNYDVAWDAVAFVQMGGTPGTPIGGPPGVKDAPRGSNPAWIQCGCARRTAGDPVDTSTGYFGDSFTDLSTPGRGLPLNFTRSYASAQASPSGPNAALVVNGPFGYGWTFSYNLSAQTDSGTGNVTVNQEDGSQVAFTDTSGTYTPTLLRNDAALVKSGTTYVYTRRGRDVFVFDVSTGHLISETDLAGRKASPSYATSLAYDGSGHLSTITDPANHTYTLTWTGSHITGLSDTAGRQVTYAYDTSNNLTDVYGVGTTRTPSVMNNDRFQYTYTSAHLMATMREPNAYGSTVTPTPVTTMSYDSSERVHQQTDQLGRITTFTYGPNSTAGLVAGQTEATDPAGHNTIDTYTNGLLTAETKGAGTSNAGTWTYTYDPVTLGVSTLTDPAGHFQTFTYDDQGNRSSQSDARGYTTSYTYDALGDLTSKIDATGVKTTYGYDDAGHIKTSTGTNDGTLAYGLPTSTQQQAIGQTAEVPDGNPITATLRSTSAYYDDAAHPGDLSRAVDARAFTTTMTYDSFGNLITRTDAETNETKYGYDTGKGWLTSTVTANGVAAGIVPGCTPPSRGCTTYGHDAWGHVTLTTDPLGHKTSAVFDADGNQTSSTDGNNQQTIVTFDFADQAVQQKRADGTLTKTSYNPDGTVYQTIDGASNTTTYGYDGQGRQSTRKDPKNRMTTTVFDATGNISTVKDPDNRVATYSHDATGETTGISYSDSATHSATTIYDPDGRRSSMTDGTGTSTWSYDDFGDVLSRSNGAGSTVGYAYDADGNATSVVYPGNGHTVTQVFDKIGRLSSTKDWNAKTTTFGYDKDDNLTLTTYPNTTTVIRVLDNADQLSSTTLKTGSTTDASITYPRDTAGQVSGETPVGVPGSTQTYGYTSLEQVKSSTVAGVATSFGYDSADNPTAVGTATQTFDAADQLCWSTASSPPSPTCSTAPSGSTTYTFNNEGQRTKALTGSVAATYSYDQAGRLTSSAKGTTTSSYRYDGTGLRAAKTVNGVTTPFTWDVADDLVSDGTTSYLYGPSGVPVEQIGSSSTQWFFSDQLGSTRALTSSTGAIVGAYGYSVYGTVSSHTGSTSSPLQYAGQYTDAETGFQYLRARYYDPATAQFLSVDPAVGKTLSPYGYTTDNPLNGIDPTGLVTIGGCLAGWAASIVGGFKQACLVLGVSNGNWTLGDAETTGAGAYWTLAGAGLGVTAQGSNAKEICDLGGPFKYAGGSGGDVAGVAGDYFAGTSADGDVKGFDASVQSLWELPDPAPAEIHGGKSVTTVHTRLSWSWNPLQDVNNAIGHLVDPLG